MLCTLDTRAIEVIIAITVVNRTVITIDSLRKSVQLKYMSNLDTGL